MAPRLRLNSLFGGATAVSSSSIGMADSCMFLPWEVTRGEGLTGLVGGGVEGSEESVFTSPGFFKGFWGGAPLLFLLLISSLASLSWLTSTGTGLGSFPFGPSSSVNPKVGCLS